MAVSTPLALVEDLEAAWRPLKAAEKTRAEYYLGVASRKIRRRWKTVDARIATGELGEDDVKDVVVDLVLPKLDAPPVHNAKSWSQGAGPYSQQVTLQSGVRGLFEFEDWMVEVFEDSGGTSAPIPVGDFPPSGRYESISLWPEERK
ncbi:Gp19/Gp15/Gp42 family protein [Arthrobacter sp. lap29]|uniref:Gp19/Gp15/Gp42 family protein n=1 Tax=Arthrobacter sp. lap29 TaxID=3056122 RepID=UPI0028F6C90F|nr:Gp19/Gp15/Gp42 family protein [Arthrobacter sp. lap29]